MIGPTYGDAASHGQRLRQTATLRQDLARLSAEMASGRPADAARHARADAPRLSEIEHRLIRHDATTRALREGEARLSVMQTALGRVEDARAGLVARTVGPAATSTTTARAAGAAAGQAAFRDMVAALGAQVGGASLFAGTATDRAALPPADAMLAGLRTAVAGLTSASDVEAAVDAWFAPGGGYDAAYGGTATDATIPTETGTLALPARADDQALRQTLRATALVALTDSPDLAPTAAATLLARGRDALLSTAEPLVTLRARVGLAEETVAGAIRRADGQATDLARDRAGLALVDPHTTAVNLRDAQTRMETSYAVTARLAGLSLVNYLR